MAGVGLLRPGLTVRVVLVVAVLVSATALLSWWVAGRVVLRPFAEAVFDSFVDQAVFLAEEVERGAPPVELAERTGLRITAETEPPDRTAGRRWRRDDRRGREVIYRPGPRNRVYVQIDDGWVLVRRDLDLERPQARLSSLIIAGTLLLILAASWIARQATRPVQTATRAMARIAGGELGHRLAPQGPPELVEVARSFNAMADRIEGLVASEKQLMAGVSHELRTPLARLRLQLELLGDAGADPGRLTAMEQDVAELDALIGELLELSRLELAERPLELQAVDLRQLAGDAVLAADLAEHEVEVTGDGGVLEGDRNLLLRAVTNLLTNAGRYAPAGTRVTVVASPGLLAVEDEGPGVPDDELPHLFEPFYRGEKSRSRETGGIGLGLMIVRQVARLHGGTVTAENRAEGGLRVAIRVPASGA